MQTCNPSCVSSFPNTDWAKGCGVTTRTGGIPFLTFYKCDPDLSFPYAGTNSVWDNLDNVTWALCNGHLLITGEGLGQKPKGTFQKRRITSCSPEMTVSGTKTVQFQDFNTDPDDLLDFNFWNAVQESKRFLQFGYVGCNDLWYQPSGNWDIEVDQVIEDNSDGLSFYDILITFQETGIVTPIKVDGLTELLSKFTTADYCY